MSEQKVIGIGICIKQYINEDDLIDYRDDNLGVDDIRIWNVGDECVILSGYNPNYWKPKA